MKARGGWTIDNLIFARVGDDKIIGTAQLRDEDRKPQERNPLVITSRDGKIVDMQGCATRLEAEQFARPGSAQYASVLRVRPIPVDGR